MNLKLHFLIEGMLGIDCVSCIKQSLEKIKGVKIVRINFKKRTLVATVHSSISPALIEDCISGLGYYPFYQPTTQGEDFRYCLSKKNLIMVLVFALLEFYIATAPLINLPLPHIINPISNIPNFIMMQIFLTTIVLIYGMDLILSGIKTLILLKPNINSLIAISVLFAYCYSLSQTVSNPFHALNFYYESTTMIMLFIIVANYLESQSKVTVQKTTMELLRLIPKQATIVSNLETIKIRASLVKEGEVVVVHSGEQIPVDGILCSGEGSINTALLTGEKSPKLVSKNDIVSGGTMCIDGCFYVKATCSGQKIALVSMIKSVINATKEKAPLTQLIDKISDLFVPIVIGVAGISALVWYFINGSIDIALRVFTCVLVVSCPCALSLATPMAMLAGTGTSSKLGILFKDSKIIEQYAKIKTIVFDKTGTLTDAHYQVLQMNAVNQAVLNPVFLQYALSAESCSNHPIAVAITTYCEEKKIEKLPCTLVKNFYGRGIMVQIQEKKVAIGSASLMEYIGISKTVLPAPPKGITGIYMAIDGVVELLITLKDTVRTDAKKTISLLQSMGIEPILFTGDSLSVAETIAEELGIEKFISNILPEEKSIKIKKLQVGGRKIAMVGDGVHDIPALTSSDVGIALQSSTQIAAESCGIIILQDKIDGIVTAMVLARKIMRTVKENLCFAIIFNIICIPISTGILRLVKGPFLTPNVAGFIMLISSLAVIANSLKLLKYKPTI